MNIEVSLMFEAHISLTRFQVAKEAIDEEGRKTEWAIEFLANMVEKGCTPTWGAFTILIEGLAEAALEVLNELSTRDYPDVRLDNQNILEIEYFSNLKPKLEFVRLMLDKSPVWLKMRQRSDIAPVVHRTALVQAMTQDLGIANAALQQVLALMSKIRGKRQELQHAR
nr:hypothetical protein [Tanacetum cinerariifolium]